MPTCKYVLSKCGELPVHYCDKTVSYKIVLDDNNTKYRKYNPLCDEHMVHLTNNDKEDV